MEIRKKMWVGVFSEHSVCILLFVFSGFSFVAFFLQYFDTVGWVFWPVETVSHITYTVLAGTQYTTQPILQNNRHYKIWTVSPLMWTLNISGVQKFEHLLGFSVGLRCDQ